MISKNIQKIFDIGLVPLIVLDDVEDAVPLGKALVAGGIPVAEVTFRTAAGGAVIEKMAQEVPEILVGAGTVHDVEHAKEAVEKGAKFIVTPGFNLDVVKWCVDNNIDVIPGTVAPSDIEAAMNLGLSVCKFFPAEAYGGVKTLKALAGPYADIKFMPTGGVSENNMNEYLALSNVGAIGGSFMTPSKLVKEKRWNEITDVCKAIVKKMLGFELAHVGINTKDANEANDIANTLGNVFLQEKRETSGAYFSGDVAEVVKGSFLGEHGHICIDTIDMPRAIAYLKRIGVKFNDETWAKDDKGNIINVYLKDDIGGFAVHVRRKIK